ncbi:hypothetical protein PQS31_15045 [Luteimonas sp BLCC-B24]|nr:hypothetical protein [Luteimonas sp. BLCC-B24]MDC7808130.1 hypothetical protein [Luteimonas sp. BLCC-B24]
MTRRSGPARTVLAAAGRLAAHAVVVAIEMRAVARIAPVHRGGAGGAGFTAIAEHGVRARWRRSVGRPRGGARGRRRDGRGRRRSRAVAVIAAVRAVVVAAVPVEAAAVRVNGAEHGHAGERAEHGMEASGQGRHGGRQARAHLQACIVRATGARRMMRRWSERPGCSGISCRGVSSVGSRAARLGAARRPSGLGREAASSTAVLRASAAMFVFTTAPHLQR